MMDKSIPNMMISLVSLVSLGRLKPHENHDPFYARQLLAKIKKSGIWTVPIIVENTFKIILDGHHRFNAAKQLGLDIVPAIIVDYQCTSIEILSWRSDKYVDREIVIRAGRTGNLLPIKTSKHNFKTPLPSCHFKIDELLLESVA